MKCKGNKIIVMIWNYYYLLSNGTSFAVNVKKKQLLNLHCIFLIDCINAHKRSFCDRSIIPHIFLVNFSAMSLNSFCNEISIYISPIGSLQVITLCNKGYFVISRYHIHICSCFCPVVIYQHYLLHIVYKISPSTLVD